MAWAAHYSCSYGPDHSNHLVRICLVDRRSSTAVDDAFHSFDLPSMAAARKAAAESYAAVSCNATFASEQDNLSASETSTYCSAQKPEQYLQVVLKIPVAAVHSRRCHVEQTAVDPCLRCQQQPERCSRSHCKPCAYPPDQYIRCVAARCDVADFAVVVAAVVDGDFEPLDESALVEKQVVA